MKDAQIEAACRELARVSGGKLVGTPDFGRLGGPRVAFRLNHAGFADAVLVNGGWLAFGKKKPVATLLEAARQNIQRVISQQESEVRRLRDVLRTLPAAITREAGDEGGMTP